MIPTPVHPRLAEAMATTGYGWWIWDRSPRGWKYRGAASRAPWHVWALMRAARGGVQISYAEIARACGFDRHSGVMYGVRRYQETTPTRNEAMRAAMTRTRFDAPRVPDWGRSFVGRPIVYAEAAS